jgi:ABC-type lipoprotein release transport system permease subunit
MIIGVAAFMVVFSVLQGFNSYIDEKIAGIGSNTFTIQRFNFEDFKDTDTIAEAQRRNKELTLMTWSISARACRSSARSVQKRRQSPSVKAGANLMEDVTVDGAEPVIGEIENIDVAEGRYFAEAENKMEPRGVHRNRRLRTNSFRRAARLDRRLIFAAFPIA